MIAEARASLSSRTQRLRGAAAGTYNCNGVQSYTSIVSLHSFLTLVPSHELRADGKGAQGTEEGLGEGTRKRGGGTRKRRALHRPAGLKKGVEICNHARASGKRRRFGVGGNWECYLSGFAERWSTLKARITTFQKATDNIKNTGAQSILTSFNKLSRQVLPASAPHLPSHSSSHFSSPRPTVSLTNES